MSGLISSFEYQNQCVTEFWGPFSIFYKFYHPLFFFNTVIQYASALQSGLLHKIHHLHSHVLQILAHTPYIQMHYMSNTAQSFPFPNSLIQNPFMLKILKNYKSNGKTPSNVNQTKIFLLLIFSFVWLSIICLVRNSENEEYTSDSGLS